MNDDAYLRDSWNVIDFMCVLSSVAGMIPSLSNAGAVKVLRTFRVLRPLLAIKRFKTLQLLLNTLFKSMLRCARVPPTPLTHNNAAAYSLQRCCRLLRTPTESAVRLSRTPHSWQWDGRAYGLESRLRSSLSSLCSPHQFIPMIALETSRHWPQSHSLGLPALTKTQCKRNASKTNTQRIHSIIGPAGFSYFLREWRGL